MIRCLLLFGVLFSALNTLAQDFKINAPRSRFGVGEYYNEGIGRNRAMGGIGVSNTNRLFINLNNPALLSETKYTVFDAGLLSQYRTLKTDNATQQNSDIVPAYLAISLPISKKWKTAFSLTPYTYSEYNTEVSQAVSGNPSATNKTTFQGSGGINKFSFSNGVKINSNFAVGLTASYLFGKQQEDIVSRSSSTSNFTKISDEISYTGFQFKTGLSFRKELKKITAPVRSKLIVTNQDYISPKEQIENCLDSLSAKDSENLKQSTEDCKKKVIKIPRKYVFEDTLYQKDVFFAKEFIDSISTTAVVGQYFMLIPNYSDLMFHSSIKDRVDKIKLRKFLKGINTKGYGVFVLGNAPNATEEELTTDLTNLLLEKKSINNSQARKLTNNYLKRNSGIFFNSGLTYLFGSKLNTSYTSSENTFNAGGILQTADSTSFSDGKTNLPWEISFGISLDKPFARGKRSDGTSRKSTWSVGSEIFFMNGNNYSNRYKTNDLVNSYGIRMGGEIIPDINSKLSREYFKRVFYRFGAVAKKLPYEQNGKSVDDIGITFGLGLPVGRYDFKYNYPKYINLGFELGKRGAINKGQIKENYFFTTLSFTINDKWFKRSKLGL